MKNIVSRLRRALTSKSWLPDLALIALAWWAAFWLRFNLGLPSPYVTDALVTSPLVPCCTVNGMVMAHKLPNCCEEAP